MRFAGREWADERVEGPAGLAADQGAGVRPVREGLLAVWAARRDGRPCDRAGAGRLA